MQFQRKFHSSSTSTSTRNTRRRRCVFKRSYLFKLGAVPTLWHTPLPHTSADITRMIQYLGPLLAAKAANIPENGCGPLAKWGCRGAQGSADRSRIYACPTVCSCAPAQGRSPARTAHIDCRTVPRGRCADPAPHYTLGHAALGGTRAALTHLAGRADQLAREKSSSGMISVQWRAPVRAS